MRMLNSLALLFLLALTGSLSAQATHARPIETPPRTGGSPDPACTPAMRQQLEQEIAETNKDVSGMTARATMLRSNAGIVQDSAARSALQIDSDLWLSLIASMRRRIDRLQAVLDTCDSGRKAPTSGDNPKLQ